jgi:hypothetical protein
MAKLKNTVVARIALIFLTFIAGLRLLGGRLFLWGEPQSQASTQTSVRGVRLVKGAPPNAAQKIPVVSGNSLKSNNLNARSSRAGHQMGPNKPFCVPVVGPSGGGCDDCNIGGGCGGGSTHFFPTSGPSEGPTGGGGTTDGCGHPPTPTPLG